MTASEDVLAALRRKRDEYPAKWAALVDVLEDLGDPHPDGEAEPADGGDADAETEASEADEADGDDGDEDEDEQDEEEEEEEPAPRPHAVAPAANGRPAGGIHAAAHQRRVTIARYLATNGPTRVMAVAKALGIPDGSIHSLIKHEFFRTTDQGVEVTQAGREAIRG